MIFSNNFSKYIINKDTEGNFQDLSMKFFITLLIISVFPRIPFLFMGFGEGDAWLVANSALRLGKDFTYIPSRNPGFPIFEALMTIIVPLGWFYSNLFVLISFYLLLFVLYKICKFYNISSPKLFCSIYAFIPSSIIYSTETMDYFLAILFFSTSWYYVKRESFITSGIFLGLAIGTRLTTGIFSLFFVLLVFTNKSIKTKQKVYRVSKIATVSFIIAAICYTPAVYLYGLKVFSNPGAEYVYRNFDIVFVMQNFLTNSMLFTSILSWIGFIIFGFSAIKQKRFKKSENMELLFYIFLNFLLFSIFPFKAAYLLPMVIPVMFLGRLNLSNKAFFLIALLIISGNFVDFHVRDLRITNSDTVESYENRSFYMEMTSTVINYQFPANSIVVVGFYIAGIQHELLKGYPDTWEENVSIYYVLSQQDVSNLNETSIYYLSQIIEFNLRITNVYLPDYGISID